MAARSMTTMSKATSGKAIPNRRQLEATASESSSTSGDDEVSFKGCAVGLVADLTRRSRSGAPFRAVPDLDLAAADDVEPAGREGDVDDRERADERHRAPRMPPRPD